MNWLRRQIRLHGRFPVFMAFMMIGIIAFIAFAFIYTTVLEQQLQDLFKDVLPTYSNGDWSYAQDQAPYLHNKVVVVDSSVTPAILHEVHFELGSILEAKTPDEVGTVVWLHCKEYVYGQYNNTATGYWTKCDLTLMDLQARLRWDSITFEGERPPEYKSGGGDFHAAKPYPAILAYLNGLPRQ